MFLENVGLLTAQGSRAAMLETTYRYQEPEPFLRSQTEIDRPVFHAWREPAEKKLYLHLLKAEAESCIIRLLKSPDARYLSN